MLVRDVSLSATSSSRLAIEQAAAALRSGNYSDAERALRAQIAANPFDGEALHMLADLFLDQGKAFESLLLLRRAVGAIPAAAAPRLALARLLERQGENIAALGEIEMVREPFRSSFELLTVKAAILGKLGRHDDEIPLYETLLRDHPHHPALWKDLGIALKTVGRTDEAIIAFRRAVALRPAYGEAWWSLANLKTAQFGDHDLKAMRKALKEKVSQDDKLHLHFALGKAFEARANHERSFFHYAAGNRLRAERLSPDETRVTEFVDRAIAFFDRGIFKCNGGGGNPARDPIFVVGLQRSGSTLIEQILASHPDIEGTTELTVIPQLWMKVGGGGDPFKALSQLDSDALTALGADYLERSRPYRSTDRTMFIDKLPANWMHIGFIRMILPNARIIDARRHPMACGFSNFSQHYASGVTFAYSLESIGQFYADYLRLMTHFDEVQSGAVHHIINERLIEDTEGEIRRLLDYVGVPFDPTCLDFHRNKRAVRTPSAEQVRRPINRDGMHSWRPYEPWLGPLRNALGDAVHHWDRGQ